MADWSYDPAIAEAIFSGRILRLPSLRSMAEHSLGPISDTLWQQIKAKWQWHDGMTNQELERLKPR